MSWTDTNNTWRRRGRTTGLAVVVLILTIPVIGWTTASLLAIASVSLSPESVTAGSSATGKVTLDAIPKASVNVTLASLDPSVATVPSSVLVGAGKRENTFQVRTIGGATGCAKIRARMGTSTKEVTLAVQQQQSGSPIKVEVTQPRVVGGGTINGRVALPTAKSSSVVQLSSSDPAFAVVPSSITVPLTTGDVVFGAAYFPIQTSPTGIERCVVITATQGSASSRVLLKVIPIGG